MNLNLESGTLYTFAITYVVRVFQVKRGLLKNNKTNLGPKCLFHNVLVCGIHVNLLLKVRSRHSKEFFQIMGDLFTMSFEGFTKPFGQFW